MRLSCGIEAAEDLVEDLARRSACRQGRAKYAAASDSQGDAFVLPVILFALLAPSAHAYPKLPNPLPPVKGNPADALADLPIEDFGYDRADQVQEPPQRRHHRARATGSARTPAACSGAPTAARSGARTPPRCTPRTARSTGTWTRFNRADRRAADKLIRLLLAPDKLGNPQALARRMGVEELIWDCGYWGAGMTEFQPYSVCFKPNGKKRKRFDRTAAHQDHIHIGMTKARRQGPHELLDGHLS